jgi:hypothetical protein
LLHPRSKAHYMARTAFDQSIRPRWEINAVAMHWIIARRQEVQYNAQMEEEDATNPNSCWRRAGNCRVE